VSDEVRDALLTRSKGKAADELAFTTAGDDLMEQAG